MTLLTSRRDAYWRHACKHVWRHIWRCHVWKRHLTNKKMFQVSKVGLKMSRDEGSITWRLQANFRNLKHFHVCYVTFSNVTSSNVTSDVFTRVSSVTSRKSSMAFEYAAAWLCCFYRQSQPGQSFESLLLLCLRIFQRHFAPTEHIMRGVTDITDVM